MEQERSAGEHADRPRVSHDRRGDRSRDDRDDADSGRDRRHRHHSRSRSGDGRRRHTGGSDAARGGDREHGRQPRREGDQSRHHRRSSRERSSSRSPARRRRSHSRESERRRRHRHGEEEARETHADGRPSHHSSREGARHASRRDRPSTSGAGGSVSRSRSRERGRRGDFTSPPSRSMEWSRARDGDARGRAVAAAAPEAGRFHTAAARARADRDAGDSPPRRAAMNGSAAAATASLPQGRASAAPAASALASYSALKPAPAAAHLSDTYRERDELSAAPTAAARLGSGAALGSRTTGGERARATSAGAAGMNRSVDGCRANVESSSRAPGAGAGQPSPDADADAGAAPKPAPVAAANFGLSGALAQDKATGNMYNGVQLKWSEPPEARVPAWHWHFHVFKGADMCEKPLYVHRQSAYLFGRDRKVADVPTDHPSCSSQHAVLQYRLVELPQEPGFMGPPKRTVKPYIMDLESTNGTFLNSRRIDSARYVELKPGDVLRFGLSSRDFVLLHDEMAR